MTRRHGLLALALVLAALGLEAQAPTPVAERITTHFGRTTRVSLFSNHVVVVSIQSESEDYVHQATLNFDEYMVYLQAIQRAVLDIGDEPIGSDVESRETVSTLVVHVGPDSPKVFRYSPLASLDLAVGKIASVMDDLQTRALNALPGEAELLRWQPAIGDCVELRQGGTACVVSVGEDETIVLRREDIAMTYSVIRENRAQVILKLLEQSR